MDDLDMWQLTLFNISEEEVETLSALLNLANAKAITLQDSHDEPIYEPPLDTTPLWNQTNLSALFEDENSAKAACTLLPASNVELSKVIEADWQDKWKETFKPARFGKKLWIVPSFATPPEPTAVNINLDPGLAFGTGHHPSTALCLKWLDNQDLTGKTILDYGCGSGILGIAALKLGAAKLVAVDIDPQALKATEQNATLNNLNNEQLTICLPADDPSESMDVLLANILANPLMELASLFASKLKSQGSFVLAGLTESQTERLIQHYQQWFEIDIAGKQDGWACLAGRKF